MGVGWEQDGPIGGKNKYWEKDYRGAFRGKVETVHGIYERNPSKDS